MKTRAVLAMIAIGLLGAGLAAAVAVAKAPPGHGNTNTTTGKAPHCTPRVSVILKGSLHADATPTDVWIDVSGGNRFARAYKAGTQPVDVKLTDSTKINVNGHHTVGDLKQGYRAVVRAQVCKSDLANGQTPQLTAKRVTAHPPTSS